MLPVTYNVKLCSAALIYVTSYFSIELVTYSIAIDVV